MAQISIQPARAKREFNGQQYTLTKIDFSKEDAKEDEAYHKERGRKTRVVEEDGYWLIYTKIGQ
mgnify:CR=1 FL=1